MWYSADYKTRNRFLDILSDKTDSNHNVIDSKKLVKAVQCMQAL